MQYGESLVEGHKPRSLEGNLDGSAIRRAKGSKKGRGGLEGLQSRTKQRGIYRCGRSTGLVIGRGEIVHPKAHHHRKELVRKKKLKKSLHGRCKKHSSQKSQGKSRLNTSHPARFPEDSKRGGICGARSATPSDDVRNLKGGIAVASLEKGIFPCSIRRWGNKKAVGGSGTHALSVDIGGEGKIEGDISGTLLRG